MKLAILAALATFTTAFAGIKYDIPMMDISKEAGPNGTRLGDVCLAGKKYWASLCVKTPSRVTIPLGGGAVSLQAVCGVDCRNEVDEPATFRIVAPDGKTLWEKAGVKKGVKLDAKVELTGLESVVLEVSGADGIMAGWAFGTVFEFADGKYTPNDVRMHTPQLGILTPPEGAKPRINGPVVYGVRPGHPIIYRLPVTGQRPMMLKVQSSKLKVETVGRDHGGPPGGRPLPNRIKILNWGENPNCHGKRVFVGPLFAKCLGAETYPYRKVALDFEHNTFPGTAAYKESKEPRPVAGFGTIEAVEGDGVYITMSNWTPEGEKMAANYADVSAGAVTDKDGNLVAVASVALCRAGAVEGMDFVEAPLSGDVSSALSGIINNNQKGQQAMDYKALLLKILGLGDDATDEAIQAALDAAAKKPTKEEQDAALSAAVKAAVEKAVKPIEEKVAALSASAVAHEKADLIAEAAREGKVIALGADALEKLSVEDLKATIAKTAVTVPLSARTPIWLKEKPAEGDVPEEFRQIALNCGVSPDIFKAGK